MRLYVVKGWTASDRAVEVLKEAGITFDKISICGDAKTLSAYYNDFGISIFPTLTMFGARYEGLEAIKTFADKEAESKKIVDSQKTDELK